MFKYVFNWQEKYHWEQSPTLVNIDWVGGSFRILGREVLEFSRNESPCGNWRYHPSWSSHTDTLLWPHLHTLRSIFESETSDSGTGIAHVLHAGVSALVAATSSVERQRFSGYCLGPVSVLWAVGAEGLTWGRGSSTVLTWFILQCNFVRPPCPQSHHSAIRLFVCI